ncbi:MAG: YceI family protein [Cyclobacteriaceae bacterium]
MIKIVSYFLFFLICCFSYGQKLKAAESSIRFYSKAPIEDIEATNAGASSIVDVDSKSFVFVVPVKEFSFRKKLMQEHFNENYLESDKYPKAIFKGKIKNWNGEKGGFSATAEGEMSLHGVEKQVSIDGQIIYDDTGMTISAVFPIKLEDYKIKIPKAVFYNIAEVVEVTISFQYKLYEQD